MKFYDDKLDILTHTQAKIKDLDKLIQGIEFLKDQLTQFDNKVLNNRVINIINQNHKDTYGWEFNNRDDYCSYSIGSETYTNQKSIYVFIDYKTEQYIPIALNNNRIMLDETLENFNKEIDKLNNYKEKLLKIDDEMIAAIIERKKNIETLIKQFNNDVIDHGLSFVDDFYLRLY